MMVEQQQRARCRVCEKIYGRAPRVCSRCGCREFDGVDPPGLVSVARASAKAPARIATKTIWDDVLCGGPVLGSSVLVVGQPGVGKTHEALRLANAVACACRGTSVIASGEMGEMLIASYATKLGIDESRMMLHYGTSWSHARSTFGKACCIVIDSIQVYASSTPVKKILKDLWDLNAVRVLLSRVNAEGKYAGATDVPHEVDTIIEIDEKNFLVKKHRWTTRTTPFVIPRMRDNARA